MKLDPKNTVENINHLKIQHLSNSPKKYGSCDQYPKMKSTDFQNLNPVCNIIHIKCHTGQDSRQHS